MFETPAERDALLDQAGIKNPFRYGPEAAADFGFPAPRAGVDAFREFVDVELIHCAGMPEKTLDEIRAYLEEMKIALGEITPFTYLHPFFTPPQVSLLMCADGRFCKALLRSSREASLEYINHNVTELLRLALAAADAHNTHTVTVLMSMIDEAARQVETAQKLLAEAT